MASMTTEHLARTDFGEADFIVALEGAEDGDTHAQLMVGCMYLTGRGAPRDYVEGVRWVRTVANQGCSDAQLFLASLYEKLDPNDDQVAKYYGLAAGQDNPHAVRWLLLHDRQDLLPERSRIDGLQGPPPATLRGTHLSTIGQSFWGLGARRFRSLLREAGAEVVDGIRKRTELVVFGDSVSGRSLMNALLRSPERPFVRSVPFLALYFEELAPLQVRGGCSFKQHLTQSAEDEGDPAARE